MVLVDDVTMHKRADAERERVLAAELDARRQAEAASRAKDDFLAILSHELRTPLSPILAWSDLLRRHTLTPDQTDRGLAAIARNASAQARLVDELLDVSRIVSGKLRLDLRPVDVAQTVGEAVEVIRHSADAKHIDLETIVEPGTYHVMGDPDRLRQVVWNLLSNAVKFTPEGGRVELRLERDAREVRIVVTDSGRGIAPEFLPHVFEPFRQADDVRKRTRQGGVGLGLAIVRHLAELHGGRVSVESPGVGLGASFVVTLPLAPLDPAAAATESSDGKANHSHR
jgi:signal transduction histidine kinase